MSVVANVAINVDSSGATQQLRAVQQGAVATGQAVDKLNATTKAVGDKFKIAANGVKYFTDEAGRARAENGRFLSSSERAAAGLKAQGDAAQQAAAKMRGLNGVMEGLQGAMAAAGPYIAIATGLAAAAGAALKFSNEIDRNRQQLTLFTKNVETTNAIIADLKTTADATSLGLPGLLEATKTLAAYGVSAKNAGTATKLLGDLALGDNEKLQRFAVNLGQISSIGRAYTVDLKQFAMAGIPIFDALAKVMGTSTAEVLRLAEQGKVTYPIVIKAINELTKEGASFYNGAERGGTNLDRSLAQLQGSFESLQVVIGNAVGPTAVSGINTLKTALDGILFIVDKLSNEFEYLGKRIPSGDPIDIFVKNAKKSFDEFLAYIEKNPALKILFGGENAFVEATKGFAVGGPMGALKSIGGVQANKKQNNKTDPTQLLNEANTIARKNAETELANLRIENDKKIAKLNKNTELQLKDNRFQYEQQIADFRESTIRRIADMERTLQDQRIKANFDLEQSQLKLAGKAQYGKDTSAMIAAAATGQDTTMLSAARDSAKTLNDAAVTRRQIEFDSTMKKIQLERTLTDFKKGIEREIGEMQKSYARQVDGILRTAGRSLAELMVEGAKKAKEIMDSANPTANVNQESSGGRYIQGGIGPKGKNQYGAHFHINRSDQAYFNRTALDKYVSVNNKALSSGVTVRGGEYGAERKGRSHTGIDYAFPPGAALSLKGGAKFINSKAGSYGDETAFQTPDGKVYKILHGKFEQAAKKLTRPTGPAAAALQAPAGSRAMQVDAANNIKPYSPATAKLDQQTNALKNQETQAAINQILDQQITKTNELKDATLQVTEQSMAGLKTSIEKSKTDQRTLDLIVNGTNPALAAQFVQNEQLNAQNTLKLKAQKKSVDDSLEEKGLNADIVVAREELVSQLDKQIKMQPQILEGLNQEAIKQKEISDAQAKHIEEGQQLKGLYTDIGMSIKSGVVDAIQSAIDGTKSLQEVASNLLKNIANKLLDVAVNMALFGVMSGTGSGGGILGGFFKPKAAGGPVAGGGNYLVGEKGPELFVPNTSGTIIPADATAAAMARYQRQGGSSTGNSSSDAIGAGQATTPVLSMSFETTRFLGQDYVSTEQLQAAMMATEKRAAAAGAKAGVAQVSSQMRNSPAYRRQVGLR